MWTTDALSSGTSWDLITFIFFGYMLYKACRNPIRQIIWDILKSPLKGTKTIKEKIQASLIWIGIYVVLIILIGGWIFHLIKIIKMFLYV